MLDPTPLNRPWIEVMFTQPNPFPCVSGMPLRWSDRAYIIRLVVNITGLHWVINAIISAIQRKHRKFS